MEKTNLGGMRLTKQRGAKTLVTGLLGFFSLDTLVDLFTSQNQHSLLLERLKESGLSYPGIIHHITPKSKR